MATLSITQCLGCPGGSLGSNPNPACVCWAPRLPTHWLSLSSRQTGSGPWERVLEAWEGRAVSADASLLRQEKDKRILTTFACLCIWASPSGPDGESHTLAPSCRFSGSFWERYTGPQQSQLLLLCSQAHDLMFSFISSFALESSPGRKGILGNKGIHSVGGREGFTNRKYSY